MRILGIDPGYATIGFGLITAERAQVHMVTYGAITTPAGLPLSKRLYQIGTDMEDLIGQLKPVFMKNLRTKLAFLAIKDGMKEFKKKMDADEYGGAPLLGAARPVIKAHGSSNAKAFKNAIRQAKLCVEGDVVGTMQASLAALAAPENEG